jgi:hypothetical protein
VLRPPGRWPGNLGEQGLARGLWHTDARGATALRYPVVTAAIFGLIGVVLGGLLNAGVSALAERRRTRREARAASRLLERELQAAAEALHQWLDTRDGSSPAPRDALRFPAWKQYHLIAARNLPAQDWDVVSRAYLDLYPVRTKPAFAMQLQEKEVAHLRVAEQEVVEALARLKDYIG